MEVVDPNENYYFNKEFSSSDQVRWLPVKVHVPRSDIETILKLFNEKAKKYGFNKLKKKNIKLLKYNTIRRYKVVYRLRYVEKFEVLRKSYERKTLNQVCCPKCQGTKVEIKSCKRCEKYENPPCEGCFGAGCEDCGGFGKDNCPWCQNLVESCNMCKGDGFLISKKVKRVQNGCRVMNEVYQNASQDLPESFLKKCSGHEVITHSFSCNKTFSGKSAQLKSENIQMEIEFLRKEIVVELIPSVEVSVICNKKMSKFFIIQHNLLIPTS